MSKENSTPKAEAIVKLSGITHRFGSLVAVNDVSLDIHSGEVLALLGENGAGKSTLMKLLYGIYPINEGCLYIDGQKMGSLSAADNASHYGIGMVFQHFSLIPELTVLENLLMAWPETPFFLSNKKKKEKVLAKLKEIAPDVLPHRKISQLSIGEQQLVELCKAMNISARVIILDEPSSVLVPAEVKRLHQFIRQLADNGVAVVLITHKLADVEACADRVGVMRAGVLIDVFPTQKYSMTELVEMMMGQSHASEISTPTKIIKATPCLQLVKVCASTLSSRLNNISLDVAYGEILGIAGVSGNGQTLLAECITGIHMIDSGDITLEGKSIARQSERQSLYTPLGYIPEQPRVNAVVESMTLYENLNLREYCNSDLKKELKDTTEIKNALNRFSVSPPEPSRLAGTLSGGNLQKLVIARELGQIRPAVLACYPTMGLDLKAISNVYKEIYQQAESGAAVMCISEDLDDLLRISQRIAVIREGAIVAILPNDGTLSRDQLGSLMTGLNPSEAS